jgi:type IV pilus assembly protein PilQ
MKHAQPRLPLLMILLMLVGLFAGCATNPPESGETGKLVPITAIDSRESDGKTEIIIEGAEPVQQFTSFQLTDPLRLIVDVNDADVRNLQDKIAVGKGPATDITLSQMDNTARLEIGLNQMADSKVYQSGAQLIVELSAAKEKPAKEAAQPASTPAAETAPAAAPAAAAAAETAPVEKTEVQKGTATIVNRVQATAGKDGVKVVITGNGTMVPNTFMLEGKRLVVDIPGASSKVKPSVIPVRKGGLDKVRVGQHAAPDQKVRVVLDLTKQMNYTATPEDNKILIVMTPSAAAPAVAAAAAAPAVEKAAAPGNASPEQEKEMAAVPAPSKETAAPEAAATAPVKTVKKETAAGRHAETADLIGGGKYSGRRISLDLQDADLINVLRLFGDVANLNMIIAPDVKGRVTVRMVNIPWDQAMDIILKMNGLGYALEDNILRIASVGALTREAEEEARAKEAKKKAEDLITKVIAINYAKAGDVSGTLKKSLSPRGETVVDDRTNTIIVKDIPRAVDEVSALIKLLDKPIPQVMIEARIVEATTSFTRDIGVQWGFLAKADAAHGNATGWNFPNTITSTGGPTMGPVPSGNGNFLVNLPAAAGPGSGGSIGFQFGSLSKAFNLDLILSAMESTGEGKVISTPRVSALDNKEAKIQQGQSIPYTTTSSAGTAVQFIQANLELTVTPHVTPDNKIFPTRRSWAPEDSRPSGTTKQPRKSC